MAWSASPVVAVAVAVVVAATSAVRPADGLRPTLTHPKFVHTARTAPLRATAVNAPAVGSNGGASAVMAGAKLAHVVLHTSSVEQSVAFFQEVCGLGVQRTDAAGSAFVACGGEMDHFAVKLVGHTGEEKFSVGTGLAGVVVQVENVQAAAAAAAELEGVEIVFGPQPYVLGPAMVPDEAIDKRQKMVRCVVRDFNGYEVELLQKEVAPPPDRLLGATFKVTQLERGIKFYTETMGMTLHRKQSLLPNAAAQAAFLNYDDAPEQSAFLEIKYNYNTKKVDMGSYGSQLVIATPDVETVATTLATGVTGPSPMDGVGDSVAVALDPDGFDLVLLDQLEFMTQTI